MTPVSVSMIVKNEADRIGAALDSLRGFKAVAEVVVLDTGSTDATPNIARSKGARVIVDPRAGRFELGFDFAAARNQCLDLCTHDWVFILDGDETLDDASGLDLFFSEPRPPDHAAAIRLTTVDPDGHKTAAVQTRAFNRRVVRWRYPVHNQIKGHAATAHVPGHLTAYYDEHPSDAARERRVAIMRQCAALPEYRDDSHFPFFLTQETLNRGLYAECVCWCRRYLELEPHDKPHTAQVWLRLVSALAGVGERDKAQDALSQALRHHGGWPPLQQIRVALALEDWRGALMSDPGPLYARLIHRDPPHPAAFDTALRLLNLAPG